jgi:protein-S-isoprenylcysteine O-methyltransferase Ste14
MAGRALVAPQLVLIGVIAWPQGAWTGSWTAAGLVLAGAGLGIWTLSVNRIGNFNIRPEVKPSGVLIRTGPYRRMRHPMYSALLLFSAGLVVFHADAMLWIALLALFAVLFAKSVLEEQALERKFPEYAGYAQHVRRFVPYLF